MTIDDTLDLTPVQWLIAGLVSGAVSTGAIRSVSVETLKEWDVALRPANTITYQDCQKAALAATGHLNVVVAFHRESKAFYVLPPLQSYLSAPPFPTA